MRPNPNGMLHPDDKALENKNKLPLLTPCHVPLVPSICTTPEPPNSSIACTRRPATSPRSCNVPQPQTLHQLYFVHPAPNQYLVYPRYLSDNILRFDLLSDNPGPEEAEIIHSTSIFQKPGITSQHISLRHALHCAT